MSTLRDNEPHASMMAYLPLDDFSAFHIYVSRLAQPALDRMKSKRVNLFMVETDDHRPDPQTLAQVFIPGTAEPIQNGEPGTTPLKEGYLACFPESPQILLVSDFLANSSKRGPVCGWLCQSP